MDTFIAGGTGSDSLNLEMPSGKESKFESASTNIIAVAGLNAALVNLNQKEHLAYEQELTSYLIEKLSLIKGIKLYLPSSTEKHVGIVSFTLDDMNSEDVGIILDEDFNIAVRTGYHCAPYIHKYLRDERFLGTIRVGLSQFTTKSDIDQLIDALEEIKE